LYKKGVIYVFIKPILLQNGCGSGHITPFLLQKTGVENIVPH